MTGLFSTPFKEQLLAQRASLLAQLADLRGGSVGRAEASAAHFGQPEDTPAQMNTARDLEFALDERETSALRRVEAALRRVQAGTYGQCIDCGINIPVERLQAAPDTLRCISCQSKVE